LICYYNSLKYHYLYISEDETIGKHIRVMSALPDQVQADAFTAPIPLSRGVPVELRVEVDYERLRFAFRTGTGDWQWIPEQFDASIISDEATAPGLPNFTGAFVGMCCQDAAGTRRPADFDWFEYRHTEPRAKASGPVRSGAVRFRFLRISAFHDRIKGCIHQQERRQAKPARSAGRLEAGASRRFRPLGVSRHQKGDINS